MPHFSSLSSYFGFERAATPALSAGSRRRAPPPHTMSDMVMRGKIVDSPEGPMYIDHSADYEVMNREHDEENEEDFHETIDKARRGAGERTSRF